MIKNESVLRAFTEDELKLFLKINKFKVQDVMKDDFSITIVADKFQ